MGHLLRTSAGLLIAIHFTIAPLHGRELFQAPNGESVRWADPENVAGTKGGAGLENRSAKGHAFDSLKAGQSITLMEYNGSGIIRRIWITISDRSPEMLRSLTLAIYWEGLAKPAVLAPLGDFFGIAHGQMCAFENALFSNPEGRSFNCLVPMPFRRSARVVLRNDSKKDLTHIFYDVDFETVKKLPKAALYFHCYWSRQVRTKLDARHGEIKSMRTADTWLRRGVASQMLRHILGEAKRREYQRLSLETGSMDYFEPARKLYRSFGFKFCGPFGNYVEDPNSVFMTKEL